MKTISLLVTMIVVVVFAGFAGAETHKSSGHAVYVQEGTPHELPNGRMAVRQSSRGFVMADDPSDPTHMSSQDCVGTTLLKADGSPEHGYGYCAGVKVDGDMWWIWWSSDGEKGKWGFLGGTGVFEGATGEGTTKTVGIWPAEGGKLMITWDGTWETP